jgi:hypothetical protein
MPKAVPVTIGKSDDKGPLAEMPAGLINIEEDAAYVLKD